MALPLKVTVNNQPYCNYMYDGLRGKLEIYDLPPESTVEIAWPVPPSTEVFFPKGGEVYERGIRIAVELKSDNTTYYAILGHKGLQDNWNRPSISK